LSQIFFKDHILVGRGEKKKKETIFFIARQKEEGSSPISADDKSLPFSSGNFRPK
jgi:hypothetical protein